MLIQKSLTVFLVSMVMVTSAYCQPQSVTSSVDFEFVATVNGAPISQGLLDLSLQGALSQGQKDTPELRKALKEELINRELIAQEASKLGLASQIDLTAHIAQLKQNLLLQAFLEDHFKKDPISDARIREEYERQRKLMGDGPSSQQYRISQIVLNNETDANDLLHRIQKGGLFGKLAQEYSSDSATKAQGGLVGWVFPSQVIAPVASVMITLSKGSVATAPIQTPNGWVILKLDDKRNFKVPAYDEAKAQIRQALVQQYLAEVLKGLRANAKIIQ